MTQHRSVTFLILVSVCIALVAADDANKQDLATLQGEWSMVSGERGGMPMPEEFIKTGKRVCKDNEVSVNVGGMLIMKATFTLDAGKNPKRIDYVITDGPNKGKTQLGIYELSGQILKSCFATPGEDRPTAFETKPGDGRTLSVWKKAAS